MRRAWARREASQRDPNPAASMALLDEVLDPPLGPGYYSAAVARKAAGLPASSGLNTVVMFVVTLIFGFLITVAAVALRAPDPAAAQVRAELATRIEAAQTTGDARSQQVEQLRADILELEQEQARSESGASGERAITAARLQAGGVAVHGPGVIVTLDDAPRAEAEPVEGNLPERVNARDIQIVVNGLWSAEAEAVSVNGHRMTSTSAIRFAGEAIIVDFRGLTPPYVVKAIGDPAKLEAETTIGGTGVYLGELRRQLSIQSSVSPQQDITITPAERLTTRVGQVPEPDSSGATSTKKEDG
ncbi:MAG: DUF881 domain-containing protein [Ornithinimicrobium sp.]|uniref:DUF881 domain-containing protein n=1 Tax=Ornithinimicrobium sp. TaxID=1977084 RepID=UPI0026E0046B|nr:DUF881 domain-containing protein [Ornithinimicrobium sp.]MDO5741098.1 DUF881 domain-containing protein [Ornithinimicrobium sp.]